MKQKLLTIDEMDTSDIKICNLVYSKGNPTEIVNSDNIIVYEK